nr:hypothetical protein [Tanacetum cinerariifolium]
MHKAFLLPGIKFPLAEEVPTASEEGCHCQKKRKATARKIALLSKSRRNCQSNSNDSFTNVTITLSNKAEDPIKGTTLIFLNEYAILDRKLDTPYPMEVDTLYRVIDQNNVL